jgi:hypothetical protein
VLYRERSRLTVGARILATARLEDRLVVLTERDVRVGQLSGTVLHPWRTLRLRGATMAVWRDAIVVATEGELLGFDRALERQWTLPVRAHALAANGDRLWAAEPERVRVVAWANRAPEQRDAVELAGVERLAAGGGLVVALVGREVWSLSGAPRYLGLSALGLTSVLGRPAAVGADGLVVLAGDGSVAVEHFGRTWLAALLEYPWLAVEPRPEEGALVLHERYETEVDAAALAGLDWKPLAGEPNAQAEPAGRDGAS